MWNPFKGFPREMGFPSRCCIVYSVEDLLQRVNKWNGKLDIFVSVYPLEKIVQERRQDFDTYARITHFLVDIDNHSNKAYLNMKKIHGYLVDKSIKHCVNFSGDGFHIYVSCKYPNFLKNKRVALDNAVSSIANPLKMSIGIKDDDDIDAHIVGDVSRLTRLINTFNIKRNHFCIPLGQKELDLSYDSIKVLAEKQRSIPSDWVSKGEFFDLQPFDGSEKKRFISNIEINTKDKIGVENIDIDTLKPCVNKLLKKGGKLSHGERYIIITYLREEGVPISDAIDILRKYLPPNVFHHCVFEERQPAFIYGRADLVFPSCKKLFREGYCVEGCSIRFKYENNIIV